MVRAHNGTALPPPTGPQNKRKPASITTNHSSHTGWGKDFSDLSVDELCKDYQITLFRRVS